MFVFVCVCVCVCSVIIVKLLTERNILISRQKSTKMTLNVNDVRGARLHFDVNASFKSLCEGLNSGGRKSERVKLWVVDRVLCVEVSFAKKDPIFYFHKFSKVKQKHILNKR